MKNKYFAYCPESGFETFQTDHEAKKCAQEAIDYFRDYASAGWDEHVNQVCWGEIKQETKIFNEMSTKQAEEELGVSLDSTCSGYCDYKLEDL